MQAGILCCSHDGSTAPTANQGRATLGRHAAQSADCTHSQEKWMAIVPSILGTCERLAWHPHGTHMASQVPSPRNGLVDLVATALRLVVQRGMHVGRSNKAKTDTIEIGVGCASHRPQGVCVAEAHGTTPVCRVVSPDARSEACWVARVRDRRRAHRRARRPVAGSVFFHTSRLPLPPRILPGFGPTLNPLTARAYTSTSGASLAGRPDFRASLCTISV